MVYGILPSKNYNFFFRNIYRKTHFRNPPLSTPPQKSSNFENQVILKQTYLYRYPTPLKKIPRSVEKEGGTTVGFTVFF